VIEVVNCETTPSTVGIEMLFPAGSTILNVCGGPEAWEAFV